MSHAALTLEPDALRHAAFAALHGLATDADASPEVRRRAAVNILEALDRRERLSEREVERAAPSARPPRQAARPVAPRSPRAGSKTAKPLTHDEVEPGSTPELHRDVCSACGLGPRDHAIAAQLLDALAEGNPRLPPPPPIDVVMNEPDLADEFIATD